MNLDDTTMATMQLPGAASDDELLAYAQGLLDRVSVHADRFVAEGLPPDVLSNLADGIRAFSAARDAQDGARQRFTAATESIRQSLAGADTTTDALEAIAVNTPAARPEVLTKLRIAKRVGPRVVDQAPRPGAPPGPPSTPTNQPA